MDTLAEEVYEGEISEGEISEKNRRLAITIYNLGCDTMSCSDCHLRTAEESTEEFTMGDYRRCLSVFKRAHPSIVKVGYQDRSKILAKEWLVKNCTNEELLEILI